LKGLPLKTALLVGGLPIPNQVYRIKSGVQVLIATPGRLLEIASEIDLSTISILVLDEVDVMLSMGFDRQAICASKLSSKVVV
jgi:ATP-dependent RNA helicase DDX59